MKHSIPSQQNTGWSKKELRLNDKPYHECGVLGIYAPERQVAHMAFLGLCALQHRGQESAGIVTTDGQVAYSHKDMGLVVQVFNEDNLQSLKGHLAIGHNRYSTTGSSSLHNAQPYLIETVHGPLGVAHNGNLTNTSHLRRELLKHGSGLSSTSDSEVITQILAAPADTWASLQQNGYENDHWVARVRAFMHVAEGAYSLTLLTHSAIYAVRDPLGLRPLCLGQLSDGGFVVASESCAFHVLGAKYLREIGPGEILRLDKEGATTFIGCNSRQQAFCIFEYVYFARADSVFEGQIVYEVRQQMGRQLARESPADADFVTGVPDSGIPHAIGYSQESNLPYIDGLIRNRYIGRTFIQPEEKLRKEAVHIKYSPLPKNLQGKRVVLIDDSIVRGNTIGPIVWLLRNAGASEVHVRIASPPVRHPCFMGVDMSSYKELIACHHDPSGICHLIGADSLEYLSLSGLKRAVQTMTQKESSYCHACFSGNYPLNIPRQLFNNDPENFVLEVSGKKIQRYNSSLHKVRV